MITEFEKSNLTVISARPFQDAVESLTAAIFKISDMLENGELDDFKQMIGNPEFFALKDLVELCHAFTEDMKDTF